MSRPWAEHEPASVFLLEVMLFLALVSICATAVFKRDPQTLLHRCGVRLQNVARAVHEVERKMFHICLLLAPLIQMSLLHFGEWTNADCRKLVWSVTAVTCSVDLLRLKCPPLMRLLESIGARRIMRAHESSQLTGGFYMGLGVATTMSISPPSVSTTALLFLVLGDMCAAIIGVSFGGEVAVVKLGRAGKKSLEGSLAMFLVCFAVGCITFAGVELREYPVFLGALAATLTELYEPFFINDNLTIPVVASIALQFGFHRIRHCSNPSVWNAADLVLGRGLESLDSALDSLREGLGFAPPPPPPPQPLSKLFGLF